MNENNNDQQPAEQQPEQPVCGCGEVHGPPPTFEEAKERLENVEIRVLKDEDEVYVSLADLGGVVSAAMTLQATGFQQMDFPPPIVALLDGAVWAMGANLRTVLFEEKRYVDPKLKVDTVPQEWLAE